MTGQGHWRDPEAFWRQATYLWVRFQRPDSPLSLPRPLCTFIHAPIHTLTTSGAHQATLVKLVCHSPRCQPLAQSLPTFMVVRMAQTALLLIANPTFTGHLPPTSLSQAADC